MREVKLTDLLLKNVDLYTPKHIGMVDILIKNGKIAEISKSINFNCESVDCKGKIACPMFVDGHEHITIEGVESYPSGIIESGINTIVGVLGEEPEEEKTVELIKKAYEYQENNAIKTFCLAGAKMSTYQTQKYILENENVVGVKTALFTTQRPKENLSYDQLKNLSISTWLAGQKTGKKVQVHIHLDFPFPRGQIASREEINSGKLDNLGYLDRIVKETGVPYSLFKLAHSEKLCDRILEYANKGVFIDFTATHRNDESKYDSLIYALRSKNYDKSKFSISSDLGLLTIERGFTGEEKPYTLLNTIKILVLKKGLALEDVLPLITTNALAPIEKKEELVYVGGKSDLLILDDNLNIDFKIFNGNIFKTVDEVVLK